MRNIGGPKFITSNRGRPVWTWEYAVPRIDDELLECVFYMYPTEQDARDGEAIGGTGFLVGVASEVEEETYYTYAVTNSHVVRGNCGVIRFNTVDGELDVVNTDVNSWIHHPDGDDIAVIPIGVQSRYHKVKLLPDHMFINYQIIEQHKIGPGDDAFMVGRFINHEGKQRNLPSVRFGNISMMPDEPIKHPSGLLQESFAVEMHSIGGYSGSPTFVHIEHFSRPRPGSPPKTAAAFGAGPWLLGIDWGHIPTYSKVKDKQDNVIDENWRVRLNSGLAGVVPAWKLKELLEVDELKTVRRTHDIILGAQQSQAAVLDSESRETDEYSREEYEEALRKAFKPDDEQTSDEEK